MSSTPEDKPPGQGRDIASSRKPFAIPWPHRDSLTGFSARTAVAVCAWHRWRPASHTFLHLENCVLHVSMTQHHAYSIHHCYGHWWLVDSKTWTCSTLKRTLWEHLKDGHAAEGSPILWTAVKSENRSEETAVGSVGVGTPVVLGASTRELVSGELIFFMPGLDDFVKDAAKGTPGSGCRLDSKFPSNLEILEFST